MRKILRKIKERKFFFFLALLFTLLFLNLLRMAFQGEFIPELILVFVFALLFWYALFEEELDSLFANSQFLTTFGKYFTPFSHKRKIRQKFESIVEVFEPADFITDDEFLLMYVENEHFSKIRVSFLYRKPLFRVTLVLRFQVEVQKFSELECEYLGVKFEPENRLSGILNSNKVLRDLLTSERVELFAHDERKILVETEKESYGKIYKILSEITHTLSRFEV
ncbi:MAG: hypothetical protein ACE5HW_03680 [Candidatus Methanofastidiosia archaeon]